MSEEDRKIFQDLLDHLNEDWIDEFAKEPVETLDTLIAHQATVILKVSKKAKKQAIQAALDKKAPFRSKNSMSDAIILFGFVEYVRKHNVLNSMFVSSNTTDFANPDNKRSIHPDLAPILESCKTVYFSNLGQAINCIEENLIDEDVVDEIEDNLELADYLQKLHAQPVAFWEEAGLKTGLFTEAWEKLLGENRLRMKGIGTVLRPLDRPRVNLIGEEIKRLREANELRLGSILGLSKEEMGKALRIPKVNLIGEEMKRLREANELRLGSILGQSKEEMKRLRKEAFENLMQINQLYTDFQEQVARALLVDNWAADSEEE
jgi:hypothetical protein